MWRLLFSLSDPTQGPSGQERGPHSASRHRRPTGGTKLKVGSAPLTDRPSLTIFCVSDTVCPDRRTRHAQRSERNWARNAPTDRRAPAGPGRRAASGRPDRPTRPTAGRGPRADTGRADRPTELRFVVVLATLPVSFGPSVAISGYSTFLFLPFQISIPPVMPAFPLGNVSGTAPRSRGQPRTVKEAARPARHRQRDGTARIPRRHPGRHATLVPSTSSGFHVSTNGTELITLH